MFSTTARDNGVTLRVACRHAGLDRRDWLNFRGFAIPVLDPVATRMSYIKHILQPGETVLVDGRLHWIIYVPAFFWLLCAAAAAGSYVHFRDFDYKGPLLIVAAVLAIFGLILLLRAWWHSFQTEIAVTNHRVIYKEGVINRHTDEMNIDKIESVIVDQSILGRIFGYGTISIRGTGASIEKLRLIAHAIELRNAITSR
jgi:membrane protein YdbS with pleckstrin-like domain